MNNFIYYSSVILSLMLLIILIISISGNFTILINSNMILLMIIIVVGSIYSFVLYYISDDVSNMNFNLIILIFLSLIVLILESIGIVIFVGWESIGVISMLLISYWIRPSGKSGAMSAIIYNRWGDLVFLILMYQVMGELMVLMLIFAILCNSSLYLWQYWLPVAMEGPTPVSSLLHSSTIVVAGVYLIMLISVNINSIVLMILLLSINLLGHFDVNKNIAYSTSIHLLVILILSVSEQYSSVVLYIILHSIINSQIFQSSSYTIHGVSSQDIRIFAINSSIMIGLVGIMMLSAIVSIVIIGANELVVLNSLNIVMIVVVIISFIYTIMYMNKLSINGYVSELESFYVLILILGSIILVIVGFNFWVGLMVLMFVGMLWVGNPITTVG